MNLLFVQAVNNADDYLPFLLPSTLNSLSQGLRSHLILKQYNQAFGDLVPTILDNTLRDQQDLDHRK